MNIFEKIVRSTNERVKCYGAPYKIFAIFGLFNYPFSSLYYLFTTGEIENLFLRSICIVLCILLLFHDKVSSKYQKYVPLYWYFTICFSVPFFAAYMTLANSVSRTWLLNDVIGVFLLILIVDWWMFCILLFIGVLFAFGVYLLIGGQIAIVAAQSDINMVLYMSLFAVILGGIFSRNKEQVHRSHIVKTEAEKFFLETEVAKRTENLKKSLNANRQFLANISHEVRTPLQGIIGVSKELAENWKNLDDKTKYFYVKLMASNSDGLKQLMNNILDLTKFSSGKMILNYEDNVNLLKIIEEAKIRGETLIVSKKKKLSIKVQAKDLKNKRIRCDTMRIAQVITNLVSNAIMYTEEGEITISINDSNKGILISVQDQGTGVPEGEEEQIFEAFVQSSNNLNKGKGLGLALCQEIIHSHGGQIWVQNIKDKKKVLGARFSFTIPYKGLESNSENSKKALKEGDVLFKNTVKKFELPIQRGLNKRLKIAIVDDEFVCVESVKLYLTSFEYDVVSFESGRELLGYLKKHNDIDLLLLDIMMPDIDAFKVIEEMSQDPKLREIPIVLQSGLSEVEHVKELYSKDAKVIGRILKPYDKKVVLSLIEHIYG